MALIKELVYLLSFENNILILLSAGFVLNFKIFTPVKKQVQIHFIYSIFSYIKKNYFWLTEVQNEKENKCEILLNKKKVSV